MKKLILLAFAALSAGSLFAQAAKDVTGSWQGTLTVGTKDLRIVIKLSKGDDGGMKVVFSSIDQGAQVAGTATVQGSVVKVSIPSATYEGKVTRTAA